MLEVGLGTEHTLSQELVNVQGGTKDPGKPCTADANTPCTEMLGLDVREPGAKVRVGRKASLGLGHTGSLPMFP